MSFVVTDRNGGVLCKDGHVRRQWHTGSMRTCVKEYKTDTWAAKKANRLNTVGDLFREIFPGAYEGLYMVMSLDRAREEYQRRCQLGRLAK